METPEREPDRVTYSPWEPVYGKERERMVATDIRGVLFPFVAAYTKVVDQPIIGYERWRYETWTDPLRREPVPVASGPGEITFSQKVTLPVTVGRKVKETRHA